MGDTVTDDNRNIPPVTTDHCATDLSEQKFKRSCPQVIPAGKKKKSDTDDTETTDASTTPRSNENDNMNVSFEESDNEVKTSGVMVIEFTGRTKEEKIINDKEMVIELLRLSPFGTKITSKPRYIYGRDELVLSIEDNRDIPELIQINFLKNAEGEWPVRCREAAKNRGAEYRVIKGIHPTVPNDRIKAQLLRNGVAVEEVSRLYSTRGGGDSYCVKVKFSGIIPSTVPYAGEQRIVHPYEPPVTSLICFNCAKPGHKAIHCNRRQQCAKCGKIGHNRFNCLTDTSIEQNRRCANCQGQHKATWGGCRVAKNERQIMEIKVSENIPRYQAKNVWEERARQRKRDLEQINLTNANRQNHTQVLKTPKPAPKSQHCSGCACSNQSQAQEISATNTNLLQEVGKLLIDTLEISSTSDELTVKKEKLTKKIENTFPKSKPENHILQDSVPDTLEDSAAADTCALLLDLFEAVTDAESSEIPFTLKKTLHQRVKKAFPPLFNKATLDQAEKLSVNAAKQMSKFTQVYDSNTVKKVQMTPSATLSSSPSTNNVKECQIQNGPLGSLTAQETSEISWDSEEVPDEMPLSSTQQTAFETFKKSFSFKFPGNKS